MRQHQVEQHLYDRNPKRRRRDGKETENLFEKVMAERSLIWERKQISRSRKLKEFQIR